MSSGLIHFYGSGKRIEVALAFAHTGPIALRALYVVSLTICVSQKYSYVMSSAMYRYMTCQKMAPDMQIVKLLSFRLVYCKITFHV